MPVPPHRLLQLSRGELPPDQAAALRRALEADPDLEAEHRRVVATADALVAGRARSFGPYFSDRVMARLAAPLPGLEDAFADSLRGVFLRVALAGAVAVAVLSFVAERQDDAYGGSFVAAALGLPPTQVETLLTFDVLEALPR